MWRHRATHRNEATSVVVTGDDSGIDGGDDPAVVRSAGPPGRAGDVDPALIGQLLSARMTLVDADAIMGAGAVVPVVRDHLGVIESYLRVASASMRSELFEVAAMFAEFAGWLYDDLGQPITAAEWSATALEWAHAANAGELVGYVLMRRAQQAVALGDEATAVALATAALSYPEVHDSRVGVAAAVQLAQGHAMAGDHHASMAQIERAHSMLDSGIADARFRLASHCTHAYVDALHGSCLITLGTADRAVEVLDRAIGQWPAYYRREFGLHRARLALALAMAGQHDRAAVEATAALHLADDNRSHRTLAVVDTVDGVLAAVGTTSPSVGAFRHAMLLHRRARRS